MVDNDEEEDLVCGKPRRMLRLTERVLALAIHLHTTAVISTKTNAIDGH